LIAASVSNDMILRSQELHDIPKKKKICMMYIYLLALGRTTTMRVISRHCQQYQLVISIFSKDKKV